jgi:hypothetical protein
MQEHVAPRIAELIPAMRGAPVLIPAMQRAPVFTPRSCWQMTINYRKLTQ